MHLLRFYINKLLGRESVFNFSIAGEDVRLSITSSSQIAQINHLSAEIDLINRMRSTISTGDTIFDVGSNTGLFSLILAKHDSGLDSTMHCFEPAPKAYKQLLQNIEYNQLLGRLQAHQLALWANNGTADLLIPQKRKGETESIAIQLHTVEDFVEENRVVPDIVMIFMKTAAGQVLAGMEPLLVDAIPQHVFLQIRQNDEDEFMPDGTTTIEAWLAGFGYTKAWAKKSSLGEQCHFMIQMTNESTVVA